MKIHRVENEKGKFILMCPACECGHWFNDTWQFNGDMEKPTINPSLLVTSYSVPENPELDDNGKYVLGADGRIKGAKKTICHSFVREGKIEFLGDCTHDKAGQTLELKDF